MPTVEVDNAAVVRVVLAYLKEMRCIRAMRVLEEETGLVQGEYGKVRTASGTCSCSVCCVWCRFCTACAVWLGDSDLTTVGALPGPALPAEPRVGWQMGGRAGVRVALCRQGAWL